jgi:hypothetical protein
MGGHPDSEAKEVTENPYTLKKGASQPETDQLIIYFKL